MELFAKLYLIGIMTAKTMFLYVRSHTMKNRKKAEKLFLGRLT